MKNVTICAPQTETITKTWLVAWIDLVVALVIIVTGARIRLDWDSRIRWHLHIKTEILKMKEDDILGI